MKRNYYHLLARTMLWKNTISAAFLAMFITSIICCSLSAANSKFCRSMATIKCYGRISYPEPTPLNPEFKPSFSWYHFVKELLFFLGAFAGIIRCVVAIISFWERRTQKRLSKKSLFYQYCFFLSSSLAKRIRSSLVLSRNPEVGG